VSALIARIASLVLVVLALGASAPTATADTPVSPGDSTGMDWSRVAEYRIVPGDKLALNFGLRADGLADNIREQKVRPDGRITVYPIGDVVAGGLTPMELQRSLVSLLANDLRNPRVTVEVSEIAGNMVHVLGRVERPGSIPIGPFATVMQVISAAGGLKDDAARNSVLIFHRDGARTVRVTRVRIDRLLKGSDLADLPVGRFDIVYVPRSAIGNIDVFVRQWFGETQPLLSSSLVGWQLFNLDRVFTTRVIAE
jgi:polysaccharide export outer membrane protein